MFSNFRQMSKQMNNAYLRQQEMKKYFKGSNAVPEESLKIKE